MDKLNKKSENIIVWCCFAFFSLLFVSLCFNENVWLDEAFTATLVHTDFAGVIERSMADTLPPLYNILLWATTSIFGYYIPVMKLTSVLPMILTLILGATAVRRRFGTASSLIFMACITGMPLMLYFGVEIRMYSLGFFFATASGVYAYEVVKDFSKKNCLLFGILSALAGYSHHFAFVAVGFVYLFMLIYYFFAARKNIRRWFMCLVVTVVLYIPCGLITLKQLQSVSGYFTMPEVTPALFVQYMIYPFSTGVTPVSIVLMVLVLLLVCYSVGAIVRKHPDAELHIYALACFLVYYGVLVFGTLISKIMTANIFVDRYLFFSTGLIALGISVIIPRVRIRVLESYSIPACCVVIAAVLITTYFAQFRTEYGNSAREELSFIRENFSEGDLLYTVEFQEELQYTIPFYALYCGIDDFTYYWDMDACLDALRQNQDSSIWLVVQDGYEISEDELSAIEKSGFKMEQAARFDFDRYGCDIYKIDHT